MRHRELKARRLRPRTPRSHYPKLQAPTCKISLVHVTFPQARFRAVVLTLCSSSETLPHQARPWETQQQELESPFEGWGSGPGPLRASSEGARAEQWRSPKALLLLLHQLGRIHQIQIPKLHQTSRCEDISQSQASAAGLERSGEMSKDLKAENALLLN